MEAPTETGSLTRRVFYGSGLLTAAGLTGRLFAFVSSPILTRALGPAPYGIVALLGTLTSFGTMAALLGIDMAYARYFFSDDRSRGAAVERFCWRFAAVSIPAVSLAAGAAWFFVAGDRLPRDLAVMAAAGTALPALTAMASTWRRIRREYGRLALSIFASGGVGALLSILIALFVRPDAWAILVGIAGGLAVGICIVGLPPAATFATPSGLPAERRGEIVRLGLAGVVTSPMLWLMQSADRWMISAWLGEEQLGAYAFASTIGQVGLMLNSSIIITWFPEMFREYADGREASSEPIGLAWAKLAMGITVVWLAVTAAGGDLVRLLSAPSFHHGASYVPWIAAAVLCYGLSILATTGHAVRMNLLPMAFWWTAGALVNVTLNVILIPRWGAKGAALTASLSFAVLAAGATISAQRRFPLPLPWGRLSAGAGAALACGLVMAPAWADSPALSLALKMPVGALAALGLFWLVAPAWVRRRLEAIGLPRAAPPD